MNEVDVVFIGGVNMHPLDTMNLMYIYDIYKKGLVNLQNINYHIIKQSMKYCRIKYFKSMYSKFY